MKIPKILKGKEEKEQEMKEAVESQNVTKEDIVTETEIAGEDNSQLEMKLVPSEALICDLLIKNHDLMVMQLQELRAIKEEIAKAK